MSNQIVISSGAKVRSLEGVLTGTAGIVNSVPLGGANGVATLDALGKVPLSQLPASVVTYLGTWNAATNTPTLTNGVGDVGDLYICNVAGTVNFGAGPITFAVGDWVIYSGTEWQKSAGASGTVTSVAVTESGDALTITGSPITTSGTINIGFAGTGSQYIKGDGTLATFPTTIDQAKRLITEVYNSTGATLTKGTVVYINGGQGNLPTVTKAQANADNTSAQTYGVVQSDITNNNNGFVVVIGSLTDIDTQAYAVGTQLYLSGTTAGDWTSTKPSAPIHLVYVGIVVRSHPTQGVVEIRIQNGYELEELHDVAISAPVNNQGIFYNSSNNLWENKSIATALGYTPANDALVVHLAGTETITGSKTFTDNTIFSASPLFDQSANYKVGASLVGTGNYIAMAFDKSGTGSGSILSMKLADGTTSKAINLDFLGSPATYTYTFPALNGTLALLEGTQTFSGNKTFSALTAFTFLNGTRMDYGLYLSKGSVPSAFSGSTVNLYSDSGNNNLVVRDNSNTSLLQFQAASSYTYTFPASSGTLALTSDLSSYVPYTGATADVNLGTTYSLSANNITAAGVVKSDFGLQLKSGLTTTISGYLSISAQKVSTNSQLNVYTDTGFYFSLIAPNTANYSYTFPASTGTIALTSNLSSYLPLTGGTLTGALNGTSATFSSVVSAIADSNAASFIAQARTADDLAQIQFKNNAASNTNALISVLKVGTNGGQIQFLTKPDGSPLAASLTLASTGAATFSSSVTAISGFITNSDSEAIGSRGSYKFKGTTGQTASRWWTIKNDDQAFGDFAILQSAANSDATYTEKFYISASGNVGIGTSSPGYLMTLYASTYPVIAFQNAGAVRGFIGADSSSNIYNAVTGNSHVFQCDSTERMRITSGGNVGIGTSSPNGKLNVSNGGAEGIEFWVQSATATNLMQSYNRSTSVWNSLEYKAADHIFYGLATERMRITSGGNVGIGTSSPSNRLTVVGDIESTYTTSAATVNYLRLGTYSGGLYGSYVGASSNYAGTLDTDLRFGVCSGGTPTERMRITSGGNVLVNATVSSYRFQINGGSTGTNRSIIVTDTDAEGFAGGATAMYVGTRTSTNRSINAGGTINALGTDYAEYMLKSNSNIIFAKGDIIGVDANGLLTGVFADAKSFVVKSTNPSYVGGDSWFTEMKPEKTENETEEEYLIAVAEWEQRYQNARRTVDRIAFSGQVPCNVYGANVGDYIIPIELDGKITGQAISNPTFEQYQISVGKVWKIMEDGRAWVAIKIG